MKDEGKQTPGTTGPGLYNKHSIFAADIEEWKRNKKKGGVAQV